MAKDNVIQFPKSIEKEKRLKMKQARVDEIQLENDWLSADIEHLQKNLEGNINEMQKLLLELAELYQLEMPELIKKEFQFENEWGDDFEFTPDFDIDDNPEEDK